ILIGNNIVNIVMASIATILFTKLIGNNGVTVSTIVITVIVLIFGEITPKSLAKEYSESFAMATIGLLKVFLVILTPFNFIFSLWKKLLEKLFKGDKSDIVTEEELMTIVDEAQSEGSIEEQDGELIRSVMEFNDTELSRILTPRVDIIAVEENDEIEELEKIFKEYEFSRIPVYRETIDTIIGVVHEKDFYSKLSNKYIKISDLMNDIPVFTESMKVYNAMRLLQKAKAHMAVVVDEFGGTVGIVTMEDILEELVGEIWDEHDDITQEFKKVGKNSYIISCNAVCEEMYELFGLDYDEDEGDYVTVSGWVLHHLKKIPCVGDSFEYKNLEVTVTKTDSRRVVEIKVDIKENEDKEKDFSE
ncbi:MAG: hemolysin family protein, partial [Clostridiales bacterium]|nr:hemolysin family protein [Clostridiales bacterium]